MAKKQYVKFMCVVDNQKTYYFEREVNHRIPNKVEIPPEEDFIVGFKFFDRDITFVNGHEVRGSELNISGWYYIGTKISENQLVTKNGKIITLNANDVVFSENSELS